MKTTRALVATVALFLAACGQSVDRRAELDACQLISKSGDELARCLIMKYSWRADSAGPAKTRFQWTLDSIRLEHEKQAAAVLAQQKERHWQAMLQEATPWARCILAQSQAWERQAINETELLTPCHKQFKRPGAEALATFMVMRKPSDFDKELLKYAWDMTRDW